MTSSTTRNHLTLAVAAGLAAMVVTALVIVLVDRVSGEEQAPPQAVVVDEGHVLGEPGSSGVTLVEYLDFECEGCRAAYPFVERLRERFAGEVTFELRYFPMPGHANSRTSAWAVEAAAQQDALEPMYQRMYETQAEWGERTDDQADVFRGFARELGLDLQRYDEDVASPQTRERVQRDFDAGLALGVSGTPTFFLDGRQVRVETREQFVEAVEDAVAARG